MNPILKNSISILHLLIMYSIGMVGVLSNNENVVFGFLVVMILIKFSYYLFKRCILTHLEDGKIYASAAQLFGYTVTKKDLREGVYEELIINFALILLINKLLLMLLIKHYHKSFNPSLKKIIYTYVYNGN
tara:strand:- start:1424 stop:1816 length:393 start_codon:yes stop_codon:yes gene_type:complete